MIKKLIIAMDLTELMNGMGANAKSEPENPELDSSGYVGE